MNRTFLVSSGPLHVPRIMAIVSALLVYGCGSDDSRHAGKGVITETTNGPAARGRLVATDSTQVVSGNVRIVIDDDVPEAWNGASRAVSVVGTDGTYLLKGLDKPRFVLYAAAKDTRGKNKTGTFTFSVAGDSDIQLPDLVVSSSATLQGRFAEFDSVQASLPGNWKLRAKVRGLGEWTFLDSIGGWKFDSIPAGTYHVRIEKTDWVPGHETTLWDSTLKTD